MTFIDLHLDLLRDVLHVLDRHIDVVADRSVEAELQDQYGLFDRAEHATGLGFVAIQLYLTSLANQLTVGKAMALSAGPKHASGEPIAAIINAAANYWKHHPEWAHQRPDRRRERIEALFDSVGFPVDSDYPLSGVLAEITTPRVARMTALVPLLLAWRDELRDTSEPVGST